MIWRFGEHSFDLSRRGLIVGILNVTPDSFSDGKALLDPEVLCLQGLKMVEEGADILDVGAESSRPGSVPVSAEEEMKRLLPVLNKLGTRTRVPLSIDTTKAVVAAAALDQGAAIINDISALGDPLMGPLVASRRAGLILMHRQGTSETMQCNPTYPGEDVVAAVSKYLSERRDAALGFGVDAAAIILDPGLGFGKTLDHNLALLRGLPLLAKLGSPLLIGHSRKSFLGAALGIKEPSDRLSAGLAVTCFARAAGAWLFRVHDVRPHREALQMSEVLE